MKCKKILSIKEQKYVVETMNFLPYNMKALTTALFNQPSKISSQ